MITSIALKDTYNIGIDASGKFLLGETAVSIKDVPFVRYRFRSFGGEQLDYIEKLMTKFKYSSHMLELELAKDTAEVLNNIENRMENVIRYVYVSVEDRHVLEGFDAETLEMLEGIDDSDYDRLMLKDNSDTLHGEAAARLKKEIVEVLGIDIREIGVCSSPLSFSGEACLTAVKARELSAEYAENDEVALPSANHECMNCCGCIRYSVVDADIKAPVKKVVNNPNTQKGTGKKKAGTSDKSKAKPQGIKMFRF